MDSNIKIGIGTLIIFISAYSCGLNCPNDIELRYPADAIKYYDDHDTIKFYCKELDSIETYVVCCREELHEYEVSYDNCKTETHYYSKFYELYKDSCLSNYFIRLWVEPNSDNLIMLYPDGKSDGFWAKGELFNPRLTLTIEGLIYTDCIILSTNLTGNDFLSRVTYSHDYGIIQAEYNFGTFTLLHNN